MYVPCFVVKYFCVLSCFAIILMEKRSWLISFNYLPGVCFTVIVLWLFLIVPWFGLQCVNGVFPVHAHLLFFLKDK